MKRSFKIFAIVLLLSLIFGCTTTSNEKTVITTVEPGFIEASGNVELEKIVTAKEKLNVSDDEFVVFYYREDGNYDPWAIWLWAPDEGDGGASWDYTQNFEVIDGIGYMRFKFDGSSTGGTTFVNSKGNIGVIIRQDGGWTKDGDSDRIWPISISNTCVVFSGDQETYNVAAYKPKIKQAILKSENTIIVTLSDSFGLDLNAGTSGFVVKDKGTGSEYKIIDTINTIGPRKNNYAKSVLISLDSDIDINSTIEVSHPLFEAPIKVDFSEFAWKQAEKTIPSADLKLGCTYDSASKKASFVLWAPTSSSVVLNLYNKDQLKTPTKTVDMTFDSATGIWTASTTDDIDGWFYDYTVTNNRGTNKVLDPYAKSMAAYRNEGGSGRAAVVDLNSTKALPNNGWTSDYVTLKQREDAIIYEVSVRDFTISPDSGVTAEKGTYKAFIEKLPYLKELGVTHLQIMPVVNFYYTDETNRAYENKGTASNNNYNWGYDPHNYFTPEGWYSSDPTDPYSRVSELRELIDVAHSYGLGVLLDVVYNHMATTTFMEDIVPGYYFRTVNGAYTSGSGCGNDVATTRAMARRLIIESTKHWVQEYKVDGFRFDLMGLIDTETMFNAYEECAKINPYTLFVGEGWKMYNGPEGTYGMEQPQVKNTDNIAVFNDELRDAIKAGGLNDQAKGFITGKTILETTLFPLIIGQPKYNYEADDPGDNIQYLACHDNLTLHDNVFFNTELDESIPEEKAEGIKRIKMGNFIVSTSQGISFFHAGQERGRTKPKLNSTSESIGNYISNSYDASDNINQFIWTLDDEYQGLLDYTKGLIEMRKNTSAFRLGTKEAVENNTSLFSTDGAKITAYTVTADGYTYFVIMNASKEPKTVDTGLSMTNAEILADANKAGSTAIDLPEGVEVSGTTITVDGLTCTVVRVK